MNKNDKENLAASIFGAHQELENVFICENDIAFRTEKEAKDYAKPKSIQYEEFEREATLKAADKADKKEAAEKAPEAEKASKKKSEKTTKN